jgi:hypothetical protein
LVVTAARLNAGATARGHAAISCDPTYAYAPAEVGQRVNDCHDGLIARVRSDPDSLVARRRGSEGRGRRPGRASGKPVLTPEGRCGFPTEG